MRVRCRLRLEAESDIPWFYISVNQTDGVHMRQAPAYLWEQAPTRTFWQRTPLRQELCEIDVCAWHC